MIPQGKPKGKHPLVYLDIGAERRIPIRLDELAEKGKPHPTHHNIREYKISTSDKERARPGKPSKQSDK